MWMVICTIALVGRDHPEDILGLSLTIMLYTVYILNVLKQKEYYHLDLKYLEH